MSNRVRSTVRKLRLRVGGMLQIFKISMPEFSAVRSLNINSHRISLFKLIKMSMSVLTVFISINRLVQMLIESRFTWTNTKAHIIWIYMYQQMLTLPALKTWPLSYNSPYINCIYHISVRWSHCVAQIFLILISFKKYYGHHDDLVRRYAVGPTSSKIYFWTVEPACNIWNTYARCFVVSHISEFTEYFYKYNITWNLHV